MNSVKIILCGLAFSLAATLASAADNPTQAQTQGPIQAPQVPGPVAPDAATGPVAAPLLSTVMVELNGRQTRAEIENPANPLVVISTTRGDVLLELLPAEAPATVENFLGLAEGTKPYVDPLTGQQETRPFYDGLVFHRVIDGFMVQAGNPAATPDGGPGYSFDDEINAASLGLDQMQLLDDEGYPNPVLGIRNQEDFQQRVLEPLYAQMGITNRETIEARVGEIEERLRAMTVKQAHELLGYRYIDSVQSRPPLRGVIAMANSGPNTNGSQFFITLGDAQWLTGKHTVFGKVRAGIENVEAIGKVRTNADNRPLQDVTILSVRRVDATPAAPQFE